MSEAPRPVQVVVAYDFSPSSEEALARAVDAAVRAPQHVLHVVFALERGPAVGPLQRATYDNADETQQAINERVTAALAGRVTSREVQVFVHARIGKPSTEILGLAAEVGADLIFIGSHGKTGMQRLLLGSVSERVVREAKCPVLVVRPKTYAEVELLRVTPYDHARAPRRDPLRYWDSDRQALRTIPWPYS